MSIIFAASRASAASSLPQSVEDLSREQQTLEGKIKTVENQIGNRVGPGAAVSLYQEREWLQIQLDECKQKIANIRSGEAGGSKTSWPSRKVLSVALAAAALAAAAVWAFWYMESKTPDVVVPAPQAVAKEVVSQIAAVAIEKVQKKAKGAFTDTFIDNARKVQDAHIVKARSLLAAHGFTLR